MAAFLMLQAARTWADPDLWGHVRFGGDILSGGLPSRDPYSFTSDIPWVNHEWLAEIFMYLAWAAGEGAGLILLKIAIVVATLAIVVTTLRHDRVPLVAGDIMIVLALVGMWARIFVVRPQLFSLLLFVTLLYVLRSAERGRQRRLWMLPLIFALWVNLHGGWIVGMGTLGIWTAVVLSRLDVSVPARRVLPPAVLSLAATLVNPYGIHMWDFLFATVQFERPHIADWRPLYASGPEVIVPWTLTAAAALAALAKGRTRVPYGHAAIVIALAAGSVRVNRLDAFFTLSTVMLLARLFRDAPEQTVETTAPVRWSWKQAAIPLLASLACLAALLYPRSPLACVRLDGPWMPEREAGAFIIQNQLSGRLLAWFNWGQYAIWHFAPDLRVSLDGRRETVWSDEFLARHVRLYSHPKAEGELLRALAPEYAWLPVNLPLVTALEAQGWKRIFSGSISAVLAPQSSADFEPARIALPNCFPGP